MIEPIFVAQTFEREHTESKQSSHEWFEKMIGVAKSKGCKSCRMSCTPDYDGLLFEGWDQELPVDQGEPRWSYAASKKEASNA